MTKPLNWNLANFLAILGIAGSSWAYLNEREDRINDKFDKIMERMGGAVTETALIKQSIKDVERRVGDLEKMVKEPEKVFFDKPRPIGEKKREQ